MSAWLARVWPRLFAYQILIESTRTDSPADLMRQTFPPALSMAESTPLETTQGRVPQVKPERTLGGQSIDVE